MGAPRNPLTTGNPLRRLTREQRENANNYGIHRHFTRACNKFLRERGLDARNNDDGSDKPETDDK